MPVSVSTGGHKAYGIRHTAYGIREIIQRVVELVPVSVSTGGHKGTH